MIHFRSRSYDCVMYDQLLWEPTDRVVAVVATDYVNVGLNLLCSHLNTGPYNCYVVYDRIRRWIIALKELTFSYSNRK